MAQGDEANAKDDTRFYSEESGGGLSDLATDLSQLATDLSVGTNSVYEDDQARWDVPAPWAYELRIDLDDAMSGMLFHHEDTGDGVRIELTAGGLIEAYVDNVVVASLTAPGVREESAAYIVAWSAELNPLTTGASDAVRSELRSWLVISGEYDQDIGIHAQPTSRDIEAVWLAADNGGTSAFDGTADRLRFGAQRWHPAAETREDFDALTSAPTLVLEERREVPVPRRISGAGDAGFFAGPIYMAEAAALAQVDLRQAGQAYNERCRDEPTVSEPYDADRLILDPDGDGFTMLGQYMRYRPVPVTVNRLKVRVHVQAFRGAGGDPDDIVIRVYSMNRPPLPALNASLPSPAWTRRFVSLTVNASDGSGTTGGAWYTFPLLTMQRTSDGIGTWLALAFDVQDDGGVGPTTDQEWRVRSWVGEPGLEIVDGGLPLA